MVKVIVKATPGECGGFRAKRKFIAVDCSSTTVNNRTDGLWKAYYQKTAIVSLSPDPRKDFNGTNGIGLALLS